MALHNEFVSLKQTAKSSAKDQSVQEEHNLPATTSEEPPTSPAPQRSAFCYILHQILDAAAEQRGYEEICGWQPHGRAFLIHDKVRFEKTIMPQYFQRQTRFTSFQRQLNLYGFLRITRHNEDHGAYYHPMFLRGRPDFVRFIHRCQVKGTRVRQKANPDLQPEFHKYPPLKSGELSPLELPCIQEGSFQDGNSAQEERLAINNGIDDEAASAFPGLQALFDSNLGALTTAAIRPDGNVDEPTMFPLSFMATFSGFDQQRLQNEGESRRLVEQSLQLSAMSDAFPASLLSGSPFLDTSQNVALPLASVSASRLALAGVASGPTHMPSSSVSYASSDQAVDSAHTGTASLLLSYLQKRRSDRLDLSSRSESNFWPNNATDGDQSVTIATQEIGTLPTSLARRSSESDLFDLIRFQIQEGDQALADIRGRDEYANLWRLDQNDPLVATMEPVSHHSRHVQEEETASTAELADMIHFLQDVDLGNDEEIMKP